MTEKEERKLKKATIQLTEDLIVALVLIDEIYSSSASVDRGRKVARICNALEYKNDHFRHFVLNLPIDKKTKGRIYQRAKKKAEKKKEK